MKDRTELLKELYQVMEELAKRWGTGTETPFGYIATSGDKIVWASERRLGCRKIAIGRYLDSYWAERDNVYQISTEKLIALSESLAGMAQFFASEDFQGKVKGSISLLKRINKALQP